MGRPRLHASDAERKAAWARANPRHRRSEQEQEQEQVSVPPQVRVALARRIAFVERMVGSDRLTPNQYLLADPVRIRAGAESVSRTEVDALLGERVVVRSALGCSPGGFVNAA